VATAHRRWLASASPTLRADALGYIPGGNDPVPAVAPADFPPAAWLLPASGCDASARAVRSVPDARLRSAPARCPTSATTPPAATTRPRPWKASCQWSVVSKSRSLSRLQRAPDDNRAFSGRLSVVSEGSFRPADSLRISAAGFRSAHGCWTPQLRLGHALLGASSLGMTSQQLVIRRSFGSSTL